MKITYTVSDVRFEPLEDDVELSIYQPDFTDAYNPNYGPREKRGVFLEMMEDSDENKTICIELSSSDSIKLGEELIKEGKRVAELNLAHMLGN